MRLIEVGDAKAALSALIDQACAGEPSVITRHGEPQAVLLSYAVWQIMTAPSSLGALLMSAPLDDADMPARPPARDIFQETMGDM